MIELTSWFSGNPPVFAEPAALSTIVPDLRNNRTVVTMNQGVDHTASLTVKESHFDILRLIRAWARRADFGFLDDGEEPISMKIVDGKIVATFANCLPEKV